MKTKFFIKLALRLHNFSYKLCSKLAIKANNDLHPKHRLMQYHQFFVSNITPAESVLDIGCGKGDLSYDLAQKAKKVLGIDILNKNVEYAKKNYKKDNLKFVIGDAVKYDFVDRFDIIILSNALEHIENRVEFLIKIKDLAPKILIRAPMLDRDWLTLYKKELGVEHRLDASHFIEYTVQTLKKELKQAGLALINYSVQFGEIWGILKTF